MVAYVSTVVARLAKLLHGFGPVANSCLWKMLHPPPSFDDGVSGKKHLRWMLSIASKDHVLGYLKRRIRSGPISSKSVFHLAQLRQHG